MVGLGGTNRTGHRAHQGCDVLPTSELCSHRGGGGGGVGLALSFGLRGLGLRVGRFL